MYPFKKSGSWIKPKYVPADALVRYWCGDDGACLELLKSELFQACKDGHVEYRMREHKMNYPAEVLFAEGNLKIDLESFEKWATGDIDENSLPEPETVQEPEMTDEEQEEWERENAEFQRQLDEAAAEHDRKKAAALVSDIAKNKQKDIKKSASERETFTQDTYEYVIGALDECLMGRFKAKDFKTDKQLRHFISDVYGDLRGISVSNLNKVIGVARKALEDDFDSKESEDNILKKYHL